MGCDIHFFVEVRNEGGTWDLAPHPRLPCRFCDGTGKDGRRIACATCRLSQQEHAAGAAGPLSCLYRPGAAWEPAPADCSWCEAGTEERAYYSGRNYELFSVLANVRGDGDPAFTEERDVPDDMSAALDAEYQGWGPDAHSATWYTLPELTAYNWKKAAKDRDPDGDGDYFDHFIKTLTLLESEFGNTDDVRCVMWFDN